MPKRLVRTKAKLPKNEKALRNENVVKLPPRITKSQNIEIAKRRYNVEQAYMYSITKLPKYHSIGKLKRYSVMSSYYEETPILAFYKQFRRGPNKMPESYLFWDNGYLLGRFGLKFWEFGNWVNQEARFNYTCAMGIALFDLKTLLGFKNRAIGFYGRLGLAIGAWGRSRALATYHPHQEAINLTRYREDAFLKWLKVGIITRRQPKIYRQLYTGGVGSFAHEYGHALDYFVGAYIAKNNNIYSLSGGRSTRRYPVKDLLAEKNTIRALTEQLFVKIIWKDKRMKDYSDYYKRIMKVSEERFKSDYLIQRTEIFARTFEQWVMSRMKKRGIQNRFLHGAKYAKDYYYKEEEFKGVERIMNRLIAAIKREISKY